MNECVGAKNTAITYCDTPPPITVDGFIKTPNYPNEYPNNYACTWTIECPVGKVSVCFVYVTMRTPTGYISTTLLHINRKFLNFKLDNKFGNADMLINKIMNLYIPLK